MHKHNASMAAGHHLRRPPCTMDGGTGAPSSAEGVHHEAGINAPRPAERLHHRPGVRNKAVVTLLLRSFRGGQATIAHYLYVLYYYIIAVKCLPLK